jgi:Protein of unknown function (DUF2924)
MTDLPSAPELTPRSGLDDQIAQLRRLDTAELQARYHMVVGRRVPPHLPRRLLFRIVAYRLQADELGDLDMETRRVLEQIGKSSPEQTNAILSERHRSKIALKPGNLLTREWAGRLERVAVVDQGFSWNGNLYGSLSKVAFAITGSRWNGPRFFGLRDKRPSRAMP